MGRRQGEQALAQVHQALSHAHEQQQRGVLVVVAAQLPQHARQACIVGARSCDACMQKCGVGACLAGDQEQLLSLRPGSPLGSVQASPWLCTSWVTCNQRGRREDI